MFRLAGQRGRIERKLLEIASKQETIELNQRFEVFLSSTGAFALPKKKAFDLFMRSIQHSGRDVMGRPFGLNEPGKIVILDR